MKILQLTNKVPWPPKDGGAIATINMTKGFAALGHKVTMLSMNTKKHYFNADDLPEDEKKIMKLITVNVPAEISATAALKNLLFSNKPYNAIRFISDDYKKELTHLLKSEHFDIIQLEGLYLEPYIPVIREHSKALIAMRAHNIEHEIWQRVAEQEKNALKKKYIRNLAKRIKKLEIGHLNKYDILIPITSRDADVLNKLGNRKALHVAPTGMDTKTIVPDRSKIEFPSVFHIGALDWAPNQEGLTWFLNDVWPELIKKNKGLKFFIAGRNAPDWMEDAFKKENVEYLGEVEDAQKFMNSGAVMIVPLFSGSGMRIKIIEGMALGKTIVTTSIGTEGIDTTHNENIAIADTAIEFAAEVDNLLKDREKFEKLGNNAISFIENCFDNEKITKALIDFYEAEICKYSQK